jgi:hypothetical protein
MQLFVCGLSLAAALLESSIALAISLGPRYLPTGWTNKICTEKEKKRFGGSGYRSPCLFVANEAFYHVN